MDPHAYSHKYFLIYIQFYFHYMYNQACQRMINYDLVLNKKDETFLTWGQNLI